MGGQRHAPADLPPGGDPVPIVQEAGWAPGPVWTGAENLAPTGIRSPDRPARSESLYRLSYTGHTPHILLKNKEELLYFYINNDSTLSCTKRGYSLRSIPFGRHICLHTHTHTHTHTI